MLLSLSVLIGQGNSPREGGSGQKPGKAGTTSLTRCHRVTTRSARAWPPLSQSGLLWSHDQEDYGGHKFDEIFPTTNTSCRLYIWEDGFVFVILRENVWWMGKSLRVTDMNGSLMRKAWSSARDSITPPSNSPPVQSEVLMLINLFALPQ